MGPWECNLLDGHSWDDIPTAFMRLVQESWVPFFAYEQGMEAFVKVAYHKADVVFIEGERRISKQCWSYRPEGQLWAANKMTSKAYFGMGTAASHDECHNFVVFGSRLSVLIACIEICQGAGLTVDK